MKNNFSLGQRLSWLSSQKYPSLVSAIVLVVSIILLLGMVGARMAQPSMQWENLHRLAAVSGVPKHADERRMSEVKQRFDQGVAMLQLGQFEHAVTAFHRVLALNPMMPEAHINMGFAFYELGDFIGAERFFRGALALTPQLPNAQYGLAISQLALGNPVGAQSAMRRYVDSTDERDPFHAKGIAKLREIEIALKSTQGLVLPANRGEKSAKTSPFSKAP